MTITHRILALSLAVILKTIPSPLARADEPKPPANTPYVTQKAFEERTIGTQKYFLLPGVKVKAKSEATLDMIYATGNSRSFLPASVVKRIGAPIVAHVDIERESTSRASLGLSGANPKGQTKFAVARIDSWDLGVGPPGKQLDVLVIDSDQPGFGVIGRDWMQACRDGDAGLIASPWKVYFGRLTKKDAGAVIEPAAATNPDPEDDVADVPSQDVKISGDANMRYFLIGPRANSSAPAGGRGLVIVMSGGDGSAEFHPFVKRIFKYALPETYLVAQAVAVKWTPEQKIVWPTEKNPVEQMKFSTEQFVEAVIADVAGKHTLDPKRIFTLSWSSSGPAAYAVSLSSKKVAGSFVAMSVFNPRYLPPLEGAKGHAYFLYHSPDDRACPFRMAKEAVNSLTAQGAKVKLQEYTGGHGWRGGPYDHIRAGISWLEENAAGK